MTASPLKENVNGIINVNKPAGYTSYDIVARVKHWSGERRVGHAGTLDPLATGVLPVCLGQATRLVEFMMDAAKTYRAEIELGVVTDTYDAAGKVIRRGDFSGVTLPILAASLDSFQGTISQVPPPYSAVKHRGKPLYHWARTGVAVEKESRPAEIHELKILDWQPPVVIIEVVCGRGTYIRSLAYDLGEKLGCGASLKSLVRTRYGVFDIKEAVGLAELEAGLKDKRPGLLRPMDVVLADLPAVTANEGDAEKIINGNNPEIAEIASPRTDVNYRAYSAEGHFIAVLRYDMAISKWRTVKVFKEKS